MTFVQWLEEQMDVRGWDQAALARESRIKPPQISRLLAGKSRPGIKTCIRLAIALNLPSEEVARQADLLPRHSTTSTIQKLIEVAQTLNEVDQRFLLRIAYSLAHKMTVPEENI